MTTLVTEFASAYQAECHPPEPYMSTVVRRGRNCLRMIGVTGSSDDLAVAAYLVLIGLSDMKNRGVDYVTDDYLAVGDVSDTVTDHDGELLAEIDPAVRCRIGQPAGGMSPEITAVHDLLLEVSAALATSWKERQL